MTAAVKAEIDRLRAELERHNYLYYVEARPEITDLEFDKMLKRLEQLEREHPEFDSPDSPTHKVGGAPIEGFTTVVHRLPMLSIDNVYDEDALDEFDARIRKLLKGEPIEYTVEYKIDGVAISLVYVKGKFVQAATRGDGRQGDDITHNARAIRGLPLRLLGKNHPDVLEIRGEAYISNSDFAHIRAEQEKRGEALFANPRNAAAGALKMLDPKQSAARKIRFLAHGLGYLEGGTFETHIEYLEAIRKMGVPVSPGIKALPDMPAVRDYAREMAAKVHELEFEVDGLVVKVNRFEQRDRLGSTSKAPRWVIAYKWEKYEAVTQIEDVSVNVGKTGSITPVAHLTPVLIAGTTVSRASLHNFDEVERLGVKIGDWVVVEKAGKIIPHVLRVEEHRRTGDEKKVKIPKKCPSCGGEVVKDEGGVYLRCINPNCPAQLRETLEYFASRGAMDIEGLGTKLIAQLLESGLVKSLPDLFRLKDRREELIALERMGETSADNLLKGIEKARNRPLWRLLTGLNIRHVGTRNAQVLADEFGSLDEIAKQSEESLAEVNEIGPKIAHAVHTFFASEVGKQLIEDLRREGLNFGQPVERKAKAAADGVLQGKSVVVTGTLSRFTREEIHELIQAHGGKPTGSVSKKTAYVVAGEEAGSKLEKAQGLGIAVLSEDEFLKLIENKKDE